MLFSAVKPRGWDDSQENRGRLVGMPWTGKPSQRPRSRPRDNNNIIELLKRDAYSARHTCPHRGKTLYVTFRQYGRESS